MWGISFNTDRNGTSGTKCLKNRCVWESSVICTKYFYSNAYEKYQLCAVKIGEFNKKIK